jgi:hypothetical protein
MSDWCRYNNTNQTSIMNGPLLLSAMERGVCDRRSMQRDLLLLSAGGFAEAAGGSGLPQFLPRFLLLLSAAERAARPVAVIRWV